MMKNFGVYGEALLMLETNGDDMPIQINEVLKSYMSDPAVAHAVDVLLKKDTDKDIGISDSSDWQDQSDYRNAWLGSQQIYAAWHEQLSCLWTAAWQGLDKARLSPLTITDSKAKDFEEPSMHSAWHHNWFGWAFKNKKIDYAHLAIYGDRKKERVYLTCECPDLRQDVPVGWELNPENEGEIKTIEFAYWRSNEIDISRLSDAASNLLEALANHSG
jgi:hypothetical protein